MIVDLDTGSPTGLHYYQGVVECPRRAHLDSVRIDMGLPRVNSNSLPLLTGSIGHAFMKIYYEGGVKRRGYDTHKIQFRHKVAAPTNFEEAQYEAARVFGAYRATFGPTELGRVVAVEHPLSMVIDDQVLTGRIDLVVYVSPRQAKRLFETRRLKLAPGWYIVDHKFVGNLAPALFMELDLSLQPVAYPLLWNVKYPKRHIKGTIFNLVTKESRPNFRSYLVGPPDEERVSVLREVLHQALEELEREVPRAKSGACHKSWGEVCRYYLSGECKRF